MLLSAMFKLMQNACLPSERVQAMQNAVVTALATLTGYALVNFVSTPFTSGKDDRPDLVTHQAKYCTQPGGTRKSKYCPVISF